jgi:hypothetical protein
MSKTTWSCGFCNTGSHGRCPGAAKNLGAILLCGCRCIEGTRCIDCGNTNPEELNGWACANPQDCADAISARAAANPLRPMLEEIYVLAGEARRRALQERTTRQIREAVAACGIDDELGHDVAADLDRPRRVRKPRVVRPTEGTCICGCEGKTKGGRFQPGHDARLKAQLRRASGEGDLAARQRMISLGWEKFLPEAARVDEGLALVG